MENALTARMAAPARADGIGAELFTAFVQYIDRGERTTRAYVGNLRQFAAWLDRHAITHPQRPDIISYRDWLTVDHKPNTVKIYLQSVKQFFCWTAANNIYPNIAANVHAPKVADTHKKDSLTPAEVLTIENSIAERSAAAVARVTDADKDAAGRIQRGTEQGKRLYAMYLLAVNAGLRTIEISRANVRDLETKGGKSWLYVWGKGHNEPDQKKAIAPAVKAAIDDYLHSRTDTVTGNAPLFVSTGNRSGGKRIAPTTISTMLKKAMQGAGFDSERLTAHSLRHTAGQTVMEITGANIYKTQQYMRHTNPKTTEIYLDNAKAAQDDTIAVELYARYHDQSGTAAPAGMLDGLTPEQIRQLAAIADTMKH